MAELFSAEGVGEGVGNPFQPSPAIVDESANQTLGILSKGLDVFDAINKSRNKEKSFGVVQDFTSQQLKLADAVDQGKLSSQRARMLMRKNFVTYQANNPLSSEDLFKVQKDIMSTSGLGQVAKEGTEAEQMQKQSERDAFESGWYTNDDSPEVKLAKTEQHQAFKRSQKELEGMQSQLNFKSGTLKFQESVKKQKANAAIRNFATSYQPKFVDDIDRIIQLSQSGDIDLNEATSLVQESWGIVEGTIREVGSMGDTSVLENASFGMKGVQERALKVLSGEMDLEVMKRQNESIIATSMNNALQDPEVAALTALNRLIPHSDIVQLASDTTQAPLRFLNSVGNPDSNLVNPFPEGNSPETKKGVEAGFKALKNSINADLRGEMDELDGDVLKGGIGKVLDGVDVYAKVAQTPAQMRPVIEFLASNEFGKYNQKVGGLDQASAERAKEVIQSQYENQLIPLIKKEYDDVSVKISGRGASNRRGVKKPVSEFILPKFSGTGVRFVVVKTEGRARDKVLDPIAKELNDKISGPLNELIRMSSHLSGSMNYSKTFQDEYLTIFGFEENKSEEPEVD